MSHFVRTAASIVGVALSIAAAIPSGGTSLLGAALGMTATGASVVAGITNIAIQAVANGLAAKPAAGTGPSTTFSITGASP